MPLGPNASCGDYIHDFVHSKKKVFSADSKKQRIRRALGACYKAKREEVEIEEVKSDEWKAGQKDPQAKMERDEIKYKHKLFLKQIAAEKKVKKEVKKENLNELSPDTLSNYQSAAERDISKRQNVLRKTSGPNIATWQRKKISQRKAGIQQASNNMVMNKEEVNEVSDSRLKKYIKGAKKSMKAEYKKPLTDQGSNRKYANRFWGIADAEKRLNKEDIFIKE